MVFLLSMGSAGVLYWLRSAGRWIRLESPRSHSRVWCLNTAPHGLSPPPPDTLPHVASLGFLTVWWSQGSQPLPGSLLPRGSIISNRNGGCSSL